jgi:protein TonB
MKTIEKAFNTSVYAENLEDVIFDGRNQKYGAYSLRKNYNNHLILSFLAVVIIAGFIAGIPFLHAFMNPPVIKKGELTHTVVFKPEYYKVEPVLPPPPVKKNPTLAALDISSTLAPKVVEEPVTEDVIVPQIELIEQVGSADIPDIIPIEPVAKIPEVITDPNQTFTSGQVTTQAKFKDGPVDDFRKWLAKNIFYPIDALENDIKGTVFLKFTIDKLGKLCDIVVVRGIDPVIDQAAIDALKNSPKWAAATIGGKPVKVSYCIPIAFDIQR